MNETTEQTRDQIAPLPWRMECRAKRWITTPKGGRILTESRALVDANGCKVMRTKANMQFILDCVNASDKAQAAEFEAEREEIAKNEIMYP